MTNYLIIEIKIPLTSNDLFELNKVITVPQRRDSKVYNIIPAFPYLAYDLNKDVALLLSESDFQLCFHNSNNNNVLCSLSTPLYELELKQSLCDIKLLDTDKGNSACNTILSTCEDKWIKLHEQNRWLFICCEECHVRIYCTNGVTIKRLKDNGIISIGQGCTLRANSFSLYAHKNSVTRTKIQSGIEVPEVSILNTIINSSLPEIPTKYHDVKLWNDLRAEIDNIKEQSSGELTVHDIHHYSLLYTIIGSIAAVAAGILIYKVRAARAPRASGAATTCGEPSELRASERAQGDDIEMQSREIASEIVNVKNTTVSSEVNANELIKVISGSTHSVDVGTLTDSPTPTRLHPLG